MARGREDVVDGDGACEADEENDEDEDGEEWIEGPESLGMQQAPAGMRGPAAG